MRWEKAAALIPWFTFESGFSKKSRLPLKWGWAGDKNIFSAGYTDLGHVFRGKRNIILFKKEINTVMTHETVQQEKKVEVFPTLKGTVQPDWICRRVVPLESPLKGHQPLYVFDF
jgi:hypothetical protein